MLSESASLLPDPRTLSGMSNCSGGRRCVPGNLIIDGEGYVQMAKLSDLITLDLEDVCIEELTRLAQERASTLPNAELLANIVDKFGQELLRQELDIPTAISALVMADCR